MAGSYQTWLKAAKWPKKSFCHYKMNFMVFILMMKVKIKIVILLIYKQGTEHMWISKYEWNIFLNVNIFFFNKKWQLDKLKNIVHIVKFITEVSICIYIKDDLHHYWINYWINLGFLSVMTSNYNLANDFFLFFW